MKRFAVIGHPIAHSRSPAIHAAFGRQLGLDLAYEAVLAPLNGLSALLVRLRDEGFTGCNITMPFKPEALSLADTATDRARLAGAANTLGWTPEGRMWADNTDGLGLVRDLEVNAGWTLLGRNLLVLGAGGASAGCLGPLIEARPARIAVWNRGADKACALVDRHQPLATARGVALQAVADLAGPYDTVINATSAALHDGPGLVLPARLLARGGMALDMVYGPPAAPFLHWAQDQGAAQRRDGLGMLVEQAAEAFQRWHGRRPDTAPVLIQMRTGT